MFVPSAGEEHGVSLWFAAAAGEVSVRWRGPDGGLLGSWKGPRVEQRLVATLAPGRYVVEAAGARGSGVVGVKGQVVASCPVDASRVSEHAAQPGKGFHWPYIVVAPKSPGATTMLVLPNNTGFLTEDASLLRASATCALRHSLALADRLGVALLMPLFPRPAAASAEDALYLHALTRAALTTRTPKYARVDLQLIAMIDEARAQLGGTIGPRVLVDGFSASGSFSNRFAVLHPDRVLAAAVGSPGGWPIAPSTERALTYPVGLADVAQLTGTKIDEAALRQVSFFFFLGADDANDAVPHRDSFSVDDERLVMQRFGKNPVARWDAARQLYEKAGLHAQFKLYPGVAHEQTSEMDADFEAVFRAAIR